MAEISKVKKCYNCGAILQSDDPTKKGYVKREILENESQSFMFCNDCFSKEKYHSTPSEPYLTEDYLTILNDIKNKNALVVYVIDLFSFEATFSKIITSYIKGLSILVIANMRDLLPREYPDSELKEYVFHRFRVAGLKVKDVVLSSRYDTDDDILKIANTIFEYKEDKDVYFIGPEFSGKSLLLNSILKVYSNITNGTIVTENYPGTLLKTMIIPLNKKNKIYDTPGFQVTNSILSHCDDASFKILRISNGTASKKYKLSANEAIIIGGVVGFELIDGKTTQCSVYYPAKASIKKINTSNNEFKNKFFKLLKRKSVKPTLKYIETLKDLDIYDFQVTEINERDIGVQGLGWISFKGSNQLFRIYVPRGISIYNSRSKIK